MILMLVCLCCRSVARLVFEASGVEENGLIDMTDRRLSESASQTGPGTIETTRGVRRTCG
jgi:hypothetical protein